MMFKKNKSAYLLFCVIFVVLIFLLGFFAKNIFKRSSKKIENKVSLPAPQYQDKYMSFIFEVYETIQKNYWDKISDEQLSGIYYLGMEKLLNKKLTVDKKNKTSLEETIKKELQEINEESKKQEFSANLSDMVLANLQPFGRSRLYSLKEETALKNRVENRNPDVDLYKNLEVNKDATAQEIKKAFEEKSEILAKESSPEAKQKLAEIKKTYEILSDEANKKNYDKSGIEPSMNAKMLTNTILYLNIKLFSPTTIEELVRLTEKFNNEKQLNTLILDLRNNVGGAIDGLPYFLGPFIGNDQYAYQFFHQGERQDFKTKIGWLPSLVKYKKMICLINENTQSSAEVMAGVIKRFNVGLLVGTTTKGWGTVERVFQINSQISNDTKYSVFLVHSLTLKEDNTPVEGKGVQPVINIKDKSWKESFKQYYNNIDIINEINKLYDL